MPLLHQDLAAGPCEHGVHERPVRWIREEYGALAPADRSFVDTVLAGTGCEVLVGSERTG